MDFSPFTIKKAQRVYDYFTSSPLPNWTARLSRIASNLPPGAADWFIHFRHALPGTAPYLAPQLTGDEFPVNFEVAGEEVRVVVEQRYSFRQFELPLSNLPVDKIPSVVFPKNFPYRKLVNRLYPEFTRIMGEALAIGHEELHSDTSDYDEGIGPWLEVGKLLEKHYTARRVDKGK